MKDTFQGTHYTAPVTDIMDARMEGTCCASGNTEDYKINTYTDGWSEM